MSTKRNTFDLLEIMIFYIALSLGMFIIGYIVDALCVDYNILELEMSADALNEIQNVETTMLLKNNFLFFSMVSILPVVNIYFVVTQFFQLGCFAYSCNDLSWYMQFILLYRHTFFEILGLYAAVYISYQGLFSGNKFIKNIPVESGYYKGTIKKIIITYLFIFIVTLIGALLEGNVHV